MRPAMTPHTALAKPAELLDGALLSAPWITPSDTLAVAMLRTEVGKYAAMNNLMNASMEGAVREEAAAEQRFMRYARLADASARRCTDLMKELGLTPKTRGDILSNAVQPGELAEFTIE